VNPEIAGLAQRLETELAPEFRLLRPLGEGAMAFVFLAVETALERLVAVKVLRPKLAAEEVVRRRFAREARAAARIADPNVVVVHRVGALPDGLAYLIMEYVEGRTLEDLLAAEAPLELERCWALLAQIAAALAAAHQKRIIHRDVRPANVLIEDATGRAVLSDFGIAGIKETGTENVTRLTRASEVLGEPRYASPEQLLAEAVTEEADVYSFGVVAYEMLTGAGPFPARSAGELVRAHLRQTPRSLHEARPDLAPGLARLIERCLAKKPEHRPPARELAAAFAERGREPEDAQPVDPGVFAADPGEPPFFPALASFFAELRRRRVYRVAAAYLAAAFILLQSADIVLPALPVPAWVFPSLVALTLAGFPVVLVLTWIFDINRGGIQRTAEPSATLLPGDRLVRRLFQIAGVLLSMFAAGLLGWWMLG
jgi:serine/threonine protein kinase